MTGRALLDGRALAPARDARHAGFVRHATEEDLDRLTALLAHLRGLPQLRERERGRFSLGSHAFCHFHEDAGDLYVDVRLERRFERLKVTSNADQALFLSRVHGVLGSSPA